MTLWKIVSTSYSFSQLVTKDMPKAAQTPVRIADLCVAVNAIAI